MRKVLLASVASMGALLAAGGANAQPVQPVAPATIVVHMNGYFQFGLDDVGSSYNNVGGNKLNPVTTNGEFRLYPGFDAMTVNGIEYGAKIETRVTFSDGGKGATSASNSTAGTSSLYVRRAYGYIGTEDYGYVRYGQTDGAFTLLQTGVIEQFGDGAQFASTDSTSLYVVPTKAIPGEFIYADQGALYTTDKVVLITPSYQEPYLGGKLSAMASYEPNSDGLKEGYATCSVAGATCAAISSAGAGTYSTTLAKERQNTFDVAGQYALKMDGFNSKMSVGFLDGNPIRYTGSIAGGNAIYNLDKLQVMEVGLQTTYKDLFLDGDAITVGANAKWGQTLDGYAPKPKGTRDAVGYIVGGNYVVGPYVLGASFWDGQSAGNQYAGKTGEARTLTEYGASAGGNYVIGKDMSLYLQYMYGHSHQPGNTNFLNKNNSQMQMVSIGSTLKW
ncbi:MAG: porin [Acidocella sp.]|uniref:porin n=1 Tax=Acidocella sp. TaxID=50710 RepID=UPI003FBF8ADA